MNMTENVKLGFDSLLNHTQQISAAGASTVLALITMT
jgi:hypothetical protein